MARLGNFIYCLNAERVPAVNGKGDTINAMGVLSALTLEFMPGTFSFSIIFSVLDADASQRNDIQIVFSKKDTVLIDSGVISIPPIENTDNYDLPKEYKGLNMSMDFRNVIFKEEGLYQTKVVFNNHEVGINEIYVKGKVRD